MSDFRVTDDNQVSETVETGITEGGRSGAFRDVLSKNTRAAANRRFISPI